MKITPITDPSFKEFKPFKLEITFETAAEASDFCILMVKPYPAIFEEINNEFYRQWGYSDIEIENSKKEKSKEL